jgi:hypothetical protein
VTAAKVILHAAEDDDGRDAKQVAGLVAIGERAEAAFVMPEGQRAVREMQVNGKHGERDDAAGKRPRGAADIAQIGIDCRDIVNPRQTSDDGEKRIERQPRLRT